MKNVTIKDVAKAAGVSYSTVSRALTGSPEISEETRSRILQLSKDMNYTANTVARAMVMKTTKLLGLILTSVNNPFMSELAYHIDRQARARGYNIILCNSSRDSEQERELFELMMGRQVDGILLLPSGIESYNKLHPYLSRIPTVFIGENLREVSVWNICISLATAIFCISGGAGAARLTSCAQRAMPPPVSISASPRVIATTPFHFPL